MRWREGGTRQVLQPRQQGLGSDTSEGEGDDNDDDDDDDDDGDGDRAGGAPAPWLSEEPTSATLGPAWLSSVHVALGELEVGLWVDQR